MFRIRKSVVLAVILSFLLSLCVSAETEIPFAGEGTYENPYLISTAEEMYDFAEIVNRGYSFDGEYLKLTDDLILFDYRTALAVVTTTWIPVGCSFSVPFKGSFDGDGHEISGVYICSDKGMQGLFGYVCDGEIKNLTLSESFISGNGHYVGGIAAIVLSSDEGNHNKGLIKNCVNNAKVSNGDMHTGGIAASAVMVVDCVNNGDVTSESSWVGGIVNHACRVENCTNNGNVSAESEVAGVCYSTYCEQGHDYKRGVFGCINNGTVRYEENGFAISDISWSDIIEDCVNNGSVVNVTQEHVHEYTTTVVVPTCTEDGFIFYRCSCGDSYKGDITPATGHNEIYFGVNEPTCTTPGWTDGSKCSVCKEILSPAGEIPATGHSGEWITVTEAQDGNDGLEQFRCTVCGEVLEEKVIPAVYTGDINSDGKITAADARIILRYAARIDSGWDDNSVIKLADFNADGKLTAADARQCLRYAARVDDYCSDFGVNIK